MESPGSFPGGLTAPDVLDGIPCFAPQLARQSPYMPTEIFADIRRSEERFFWYRGRRRIITDLIRRWCGRPGMAFLEVGCGTGFNLQTVSRQSGLDLYASDVALAGLLHARQRCPTVRFLQLDLLAMPFRDAFDGIGAFDVLEHIPDDDAVLREIWAALKPDGVFLVTVPQHPFLWSSTDVYAQHHRRYTRRGMTQKLRRAGFDIEFLGSFVSLLFPFLCLSRLTNRRHKADSLASAGFEMVLPRWVDAFGEATMRLDGMLVKRGISVPFGGSLVAVARKPAQV